MINHNKLKYAVWLLKREKRVFHIVEQIGVFGQRIAARGTEEQY